MNKTTGSKMVVNKNKNKAVPCSTPEQQVESPGRDSDSMSVCDSECASPVPFFCTQDGVEGDIDVVWNYYTPKAENTHSSRVKNSTPLSRKSKHPVKLKMIEKPITKRRPIRITKPKNTELFQELMELNQNLNDLISKKAQKVVKETQQSGSEEDIFNESPDQSPKSGLRSNTRCLRKNLLSSKFNKPESEVALESDDSMNECLLKASQVIEENILKCEPTNIPHYIHTNINVRSSKTDSNFAIEQDSMDALLGTINTESPMFNKLRKYDTTQLNNDSFDSLVGNLNDSVLERLTQMPVKNEDSSKKSRVSKENANWMIREIVVHDETMSPKSMFGRHRSMPESPSVEHLNQPSTSGMVFGRYNSMPDEKQDDNSGCSPSRCTPEQIKKKRQQAREKLLAKRLLPFTSTQQSSQSILSQQVQQPPKNCQFQPRLPSTAINPQTTVQSNVTSSQKFDPCSGQLDMKKIIEKKRQEALMKLRRRQPQNKRNLM